MSQIDKVLDYWFGSSPDDTVVSRKKSQLWWVKCNETDEEMGKRFASLVQAAAAGDLDDWAESSRGRLALIVLLDQFPRKIYRNTPAAFASDDKALGLTLEAIELGLDRELRPIERVFLYLPLEHSELLENQDRCVAVMESLVSDVPAERREIFSGYVGYAVAHRRIVERFGRFPHRNKILGRESTSEEEGFLTTPGSSF